MSRQIDEKKHKTNSSNSSLLSAPFTAQTSTNAEDDIHEISDWSEIPPLHHTSRTQLIGDSSRNLLKMQKISERLEDVNTKLLTHESFVKKEQRISEISSFRDEEEEPKKGGKLYYDYLSNFSSEDEDMLHSPVHKMPQMTTPAIRYSPDVRYNWPVFSPPNRINQSIANQYVSNGKHYSQNHSKGPINLPINGIRDKHISSPQNQILKLPLTAYSSVFQQSLQSHIKGIYDLFTIFQSNVKLRLYKVQKLIDIVSSRKRMDNKLEAQKMLALEFQKEMEKKKTENKYSQTESLIDDTMRHGAVETIDGYCQVHMDNANRASQTEQIITVDSHTMPVPIVSSSTDINTISDGSVQCELLSKPPISINVGIGSVISVRSSECGPDYSMSLVDKDCMTTIIDPVDVGVNIGSNYLLKDSHVQTDSKKVCDGYTEADAGLLKVIAGEAMVDTSIDPVYIEGINSATNTDRLSFAEVATDSIQVDYCHGTTNTNILSVTESATDPIQVDYCSGTTNTNKLSVTESATDPIQVDYCNGTTNTNKLSVTESATDPIQVIYCNGTTNTDRLTNTYSTNYSIATNTVKKAFHDSANDTVCMNNNDDICPNSHHLNIVDSIETPIVLESNINVSNQTGQRPAPSDRPSNIDKYKHTSTYMKKSNVIVTTRDDPKTISRKLSDNVTYRQSIDTASSKEDIDIHGALDDYHDNQLNESDRYITYNIQSKQSIDPLNNRYENIHREPKIPLDNHLDHPASPRTKCGHYTVLSKSIDISEPNKSERISHGQSQSHFIYESEESRSIPQLSPSKEYFSKYNKSNNTNKGNILQNSNNNTNNHSNSIHNINNIDKHIRDTIVENEHLLNSRFGYKSESSANTSRIHENNPIITTSLENNRIPTTSLIDPIYESTYQIPDSMPFDRHWKRDNPIGTTSLVEPSPISVFRHDSPRKSMVSGFDDDFSSSTHLYTKEYSRTPLKQAYDIPNRFLTDKSLNGKTSSSSFTHSTVFTKLKEKYCGDSIGEPRPFSPVPSTKSSIDKNVINLAYSHMKLSSSSKRLRDKIERPRWKV